MAVPQMFLYHFQIMPISQIYSPFPEFEQSLFKLISTYRRQTHHISTLHVQLSPIIIAVFHCVSSCFQLCVQVSFQLNFYFHIHPRKSMKIGVDNVDFVKLTFPSTIGKYLKSRQTCHCHRFPASFPEKCLHFLKRPKQTVWDECLLPRVF